MKYLLSILVFAMVVISCDTTKSTVQTTQDDSEFSDTVRIANDSIEYEIIIIEPGFNGWLVTQPPKGYYGLSYLETRNRQYVNEYNYRVYAPGFNKDLYVQEINYDPSISYGLEVNYLLYNYFKYFEITYNQKLR
ncbi:DUF6146 family protein [Planktosalinus lacus]|uniref:Uncharacterized protein n=1 Tax=Planktosalinus lacus TaxID=1526573 RepID=A0A8J2YB19_9FLAO|nr:DUF6146 family protein [Planktosalinus lacus]GGD92980.1 hypothetical protein GCM10011312_15950 [Planktosalinus lacus]